MMISSDGLFRLSKHDVAALCKFASAAPHDVVLFEPKTRRAVATDGHTLVMVEAPLPNVEAGSAVRPLRLPSLLVPTESLDFFGRMLRGRRLLNVRALNGAHEISAHLWVSADDTPEIRQAEATLVCDKGRKFPPYEKILVAYDGSEPAVGALSMNAEYLSRVAAVQRAAQARATDCYFPGEKSAPALFKLGAKDGSTWTVMVMPVVLSNSELNPYEPARDPSWKEYRELQPERRRRLERVA